jgi:hypothetical protein
MSAKGYKISADGLKAGSGLFRVTRSVTLDLGFFRVSAEGLHIQSPSDDKQGVQETNSNPDPQVRLAIGGIL